MTVSAHKPNSRLDIRAWLDEQRGMERFTSEELDHVTRCILIIQDWYYNKTPLGEDFFVYLLKGDLFRTLSYADNTNEFALPLYAKYFYNCLPGDYKQRINERE